LRPQVRNLLDISIAQPLTVGLMVAVPKAQSGVACVLEQRIEGHGGNVAVTERDVRPSLVPGIGPVNAGWIGLVNL
jgi:hypothetical protein